MLNGGNAIKQIFLPRVWLMNKALYWPSLVEHVLFLVYTHKGHFDFQGDQICDQKGCEDLRMPPSVVICLPSTGTARGDWDRNITGLNHNPSKSRVFMLVYDLGGGFKYFLFSSLFGEDSNFDKFIKWVVQPPPSDQLNQLSIWAGQGYPLCKLQTAPKNLLEVIGMIDTQSGWKKQSGMHENTGELSWHWKKRWIKQPISRWTIFFPSTVCSRFLGLPNWAVMKTPGDLFHLGGYTIQLYGDHKKPL